ncbi:uncharacterized protein LOC112599460, partial [Melanaphis sacchari]|uniref:uncharacterized protein LOC112599460 n=1 Tax=Melanaphis sacchari TaxID=742174 RepID=UPI000DC13BC8
MVRYDSAVCNGYQSIWVCKNCLTTVLSENDVNPHITRCKKRMTFNIRGVTKNRVPVNCFRQTASPEPYICKCCSLVFRRKVTLDRHLINKKNKATTSDEEEDNRKTKR